MTDLRERLDRELHELPVRQVDTGSIRGRARRRIRRRWVGTVALVVVVMAGSLALLIEAFDGQTTTPIQPTPPGDAWIVFDTVAWPDQPSQIYRVRPDGTGLTQVTDGTAEAKSPAVSPDGTQIAFVRFEEGHDPPSTFHEGIYVMDADGTNERELLRTGEPTPISVQQLAWSADGSRIAFVRGIDEAMNELWIMGADGSDPHRLTDIPLQSFSWAPDGSRIVFAGTSVDGTRYLSDLFVMDADGSAIQRLTDDGTSWAPEWSPDGAWIAFRRSIEQGASHAYRLSTNDPGNPPEAIWTGDGTFDTLTWSPDSTAIAMDLFDGGRTCLITSVTMDGTVSTVLESQTGMFARPGDDASLCAGSVTWAPLVLPPG